jgi:hypothetical protein
MKTIEGISITLEEKGGIFIATAKYPDGEVSEGSTRDYAAIAGAVQKLKNFVVKKLCGDLIRLRIKSC